MIYRTVYFRGLLLLVLLGTSACGSAQRVVSTSEAPPDADTTSELEKLYWERAESARNKYTAADVDFMTGMVSHHAQALIMAGFAPSHGAGSQVQTLCARIINAQQDEIATMQRWLGDRGEAVPKVHIDGRMLTISGVDEHHAHMPGMLSEDQLRELDEARGEDFDRVFLTYMIQHHKGAVSMVEELFSHDGAGQGDVSFKLASDINVDQITEIARMERMLSALSTGNSDR